MDKKQSKSKVPKELIESFIKLGIKSGEVRKILGPKTYSNKFGGDILSWVKNDIDDGRFIEAYALVEQYAEGLIKKVFDNGDSNYWKKQNKKIKIEAVLSVLLFLGKIDVSYYNQYCEFKDIRNDLVHNAVFNFNNYKRLSDLKKIKSLPIEIILKTETFLKTMIINYLANHNCKNNNDFKAKLTHLVDFKNREYERINGKSISEAELFNYLKPLLIK
jgi:hypothetical protein